MIDDVFEKLGKHVYQVYDPSKDLPDLYATPLSFDEFSAVVKQYAGDPTLISGTLNKQSHPNDGTFEEYARSRGFDVTQIEAENHVDWDDVERVQ